VTPTARAIEAADVLEKAGGHLQKVGHHKGYLYDEQQATETAIDSCRVCAVGSILAAAYGQPRYPAFDTAHSDVTDTAIDAMEETVGAPVPVWNDEPERTVDDVVTALTATAARLREAA
jgi:UDP-N-acetyl-D-mannosaminuronic acid transferase (WecB/TagA/CpsF family)